MTGTLINDIIETVDKRIPFACYGHTFCEDRDCHACHSDRERADEFPLDDNTAGEPLDEMERRTR